MIILKADLGLSPWDVLHQGLSKTLGITIGQASIGLGLMIVVLDIFLGQPIGLGTVLNFMSIGVFMDLILYLDFLPVTDSLVLKVVMLLVGIFIYSYGIFSVYGSGNGMWTKRWIYADTYQEDKILCWTDKKCYRSNCIFSRMAFRRRTWAWNNSYSLSYGDNFRSDV